MSFVSFKSFVSYHLISFHSISFVSFQSIPFHSIPFKYFHAFPAFHTLLPFHPCHVLFNQSSHQFHSSQSFHVVPFHSIPINVHVVWFVRLFLHSVHSIYSIFHFSPVKPVSQSVSRESADFCHVTLFDFLLLHFALCSFIHSFACRPPHRNASHRLSFL